MLVSAEEQNVTDDEHEALVLAVLRDEYRSGGPVKFSAEQVAQVLALACEEPSTLGLPFTHWTSEALAREAKRRKIVDEISRRQVARFFGGVRAAPAPLAILAQPGDRRPREVRRRGS
jgi:hypothetical protein